MNPLTPHLNPKNDLNLFDFSDEYIMGLILKEAQEKKERAKRMGVLGYMRYFREEFIYFF